MLKLQNPKIGYTFPKTLAEAVTEATKEANSTATVKSLLHHSRKAASKGSEASANTAADDTRGRGRSRDKRHRSDTRRDTDRDRDETKSRGRSYSRHRSKSRDSRRSTDSKGVHNTKKGKHKQKGKKSDIRETFCSHCKTAGRPKRFWRSHATDDCKFQSGERVWDTGDISREVSDDDSDESSCPAIIEEVSVIGQIMPGADKGLTHNSGATVHIFRGKSLLVDIKRCNSRFE